MLCTGTKEDDPNSAVIASTQVSESPTPVEPLCLVDIPLSLEFERMAVLSVAAQLVAQRIVFLIPKAGTVLIHEASNLIKAAVSQEAAKARVNVQFTACSRQYGEGLIWIHHAIPARLIKGKLPRGTSVFVNFAEPDGPDTQVTRTTETCVPDDCAVASTASFFGDKLYTRPEAESS